ncbi:MAG: DUF748 domain-containing protein [Bilophila wadsworthia]
MASKQRKRRRKRRAVKKTPPLPPVSAQAEEEKARTRGRRSAKGWRACLFGIGLLCALWTALAVSLPPTVLRGVVESQLSEAVNAPVTIESLSVNPFTLGIAVRGVRVPYLEETGTPDGALLTIERLDIRPRLRLFADAAPIQAALRVYNPVLDITYLGNGLFSFSKLLPAPSGADTAPDAPLFALSDLDLKGGTILLRDGPVGMVHTVSDVNFHVPLLRSADLPFAPTLSALVNGTRIDVEGRTEPDAETLRTTFAIHTAPLHMEHFKRYLSDFTPLNLNSGTVALDMLFTLSQPHLGRVESSLSGTVKVEDAEIATPEGTIVGRLRRGQAALKDFTLSERRIRLDEMELDGLYLRVGRDKAGRIDWVDWLSGTDANPENLSPETPFVVEGADLILRNLDFTWVDASLADTQQIEITGVDGRIAEYSTRPGARTAMRLSFGISTEGVLAVDGEGTLTPPSLNASLWVDDLPLIVLRPLLGETPLNDILGRIAIKGGVRFGSDGKTPQTPAAPASATSLAVTGAEASVSALSFGRGNSLSAADRKAGKDAGSPAVRIRALTFNGLHFDTQARSASVKTRPSKPPKGVTLPAAWGWQSRRKAVRSQPRSRPQTRLPRMLPPPCRRRKASPTGFGPAVHRRGQADMSPQESRKLISSLDLEQGLFRRPGLYHQFDPCAPVGHRPTPEPQSDIVPVPCASPPAWTLRSALEWLGPPCALPQTSPRPAGSPRTSTPRSQRKRGKTSAYRLRAPLPCATSGSRTPVPRKCMPCSAAFPRTRSAFLRLPQASRPRKCCWTSCAWTWPSMPTRRWTSWSASRKNRRAKSPPPPSVFPWRP